MFNENNLVIILRATSSSGKSTFASYLSNLHKDAVICCADDYFTDEDGNYKFDPRGLKDAHENCFSKFEGALSNGVSLIIVANTNTSNKEFQPYIDKAEKLGYSVISLIVEKRHILKNNHNVPDHVLVTQAARIKDSLKLL